MVEPRVLACYLCRTLLGAGDGFLHELPFHKLMLGVMRLQNEGVEIALDDHVLD